MRSLKLFLIFLRLGLTSFGGPIAHLSYFRDEFVVKRKWMTDQAYADLVALCQFLPGPASSQVGMGIGMFRQGIWGAVIAWIGFTLPSALVLILFALGLTQIDLTHHQHWIHALKVVAVSVVAHAVLGMARKLCPDFKRAVMALLACGVVLFFQTSLTQILVLVVAGVLGIVFLKSVPSLQTEPQSYGKKRIGAIYLITFAVLLISLPFFRTVFPVLEIKLIDSFYRTGALVFGGGHVVLPLLQAEVVPTGWVSNDLFMAGYGMANAVPGPLFTFSAYLGAVAKSWSGAFISLIAIFLPSFLLVVGALPFWEKLRTLPKVRQSIMGVNAAVVGILLAALYHPVWTSAIFSVKDFIFAALGFLMLEFLKLPSWALILSAFGVTGLSIM